MLVKPILLHDKKQDYNLMLPFSTTAAWPERWTAHSSARTVTTSSPPRFEHCLALSLVLPYNYPI